MRNRIGPFRRLAVIAVLATMGGCEMMKIRVESNDRNPGSFAEPQRTILDQGENLEVKVRLWSTDRKD